MIAEYQEPKGLAPDAEPVGAFKAQADYRANSILGSLMLRDAILLAKGIAPPPVKEEPRPFPLLERRAPRFDLCHSCLSPLKPNMRFIGHIQETVAAYYGINSRLMIGARGSAKTAQIRQIAMYLARDLAGKSYSEIGRRFGNRDHTTVMHAVQVVEKLIVDDTDTLLDVEILRERLAA